MARKRSRRQAHGTAWHWKQTDSWYYTLPGTKKRLPLFDADGQRLRGLHNKRAAELALARLKLAGAGPAAPGAASSEDWLVARVCSVYLQYCERGLSAGTLSRAHRDAARSYLNDFCAYCGALAVAELTKAHVYT